MRDLILVLLVLVAIAGFVLWRLRAMRREDEHAEEEEASQAPVFAPYEEDHTEPAARVSNNINKPRHYDEVVQESAATAAARRRREDEDAAACRRQQQDDDDDSSSAVLGAVIASEIFSSPSIDIGSSTDSGSSNIDAGGGSFGGGGADSSF